MVDEEADILKIYRNIVYLRIFIKKKKTMNSEHWTVR